MILAQKVPNFRAAGLISQDAFRILPATFVIPHFDRMRGLWSAYLFGVRRQLKNDQFILGVDEDTALVGKLNGTWQVMGQGQAHLITRDEQQDFSAGEEVAL
jgi:cyanophycinase-like exopeptidase